MKTLIPILGVRYLSVARGWWLAWTSPVPRRSGAFVLEILERSTETLDKRLLKGMKSTGHLLASAAGISSSSAAGGAPTQDDAASVRSATAGNKSPKILQKGEVLRAGDVFRLRNVKYPEFEFGVTNVRLRDDHFYMGLAKV
jgi:hypothetical protein